MKRRTKERYKRYYKNLKEVRKYILLRLLILFGLSLIFSVSYGWLGKTPGTLLLLVLGFLIPDIVIMRRTYYNQAHLRKYIMAEGIPHGIYALISIAAAGAAPHSSIYKVMFGITDILEFAVYNFTPFTSALIFSVILLLAVRFVPLTMKWVHISHG